MISDTRSLFLAAVNTLQTLGTTLRPRAVKQHARLIESRNRILRHAMHMIEEELKKYGIVILHHKIEAF